MICMNCGKDFKSYEFLNDEQIRKEGLIVCNRCLRDLFKTRRQLLKDEVERLDNKILYLAQKVLHNA